MEARGALDDRDFGKTVQRGMNAMLGGKNAMGKGRRVT